MAKTQAPDSVRRLVETFDRNAATDKSIAALVYELYGLTDKEVYLVEGEIRV